jgi:hypothetical protein
MNPRIALVCVTRNRPEGAQAVYETWRETSTGESELWIAIDEDQSSLYPRIPGVHYDVRPRKRMIPRFNELAIDLAKEYAHVGFLGDDHRIRTSGWDEKVLDAMDANNGWGIVYGDDKLQGEALATAAVVSSNIIRTLGYICPVGLAHLCMDSFWMDIGRDTGCLKYLPDVVIEHMHWSNGKAEKDAGYHALNDIITPDAKRYDLWLKNERAADSAKLLKAMGK